MRVMKKINQDAVLVNDLGLVKIALGKNLGLFNKPGESLDQSSVENIFCLNDREKTQSFIKLLQRIPSEYFLFSDKIIEDLKAQLNYKLSDNIYLALTDHIYFAIQRGSDGEKKTSLTSDMKLLYREEYDLAVEVVETINNYYHTDLAENEACFIAMHIVNAERDEKTNFNLLRIIEITKRTLEHLDLQEYPINKNSLSYHRLSLHIRHLIQRIIYNEEPQDTGPSFLDDKFKQSQEYQVANEIADMLEERFGLEVNSSERLYLAIHLMNMVTIAS